MNESLADVVHEAVERAKADEVQIDPAAVMAEHAPNVNLWRGHQWCLKCGWAGSSGDFTPWPCEPYRLAKSLAASAAKVAQAFADGYNRAVAVQLELGATCADQADAPA